MLTALFRNNVIYAFLFFALLLLVFGRRLAVNRFKACLFLLVVAACYFCISGPVFKACGVTISDNRQEIFAVPSQQLATVAVQADDVTDEELSFIQIYVPNFANLKERITDPVKKQFNSDECWSDPLKFFKGYIKIGLAHPDLYTNAFFRLGFNYVSPIGNRLYSSGSLYDDTNYRSTTPYVENRTGDDPSRFIDIDEPSLAPAFKEAVKSCLTGYVASYMPLVSTLYQYGFWFWILLLFFMLACYMRKKDFAFWALFILCYWVTAALGPVAWFRYALPLVFNVPVLIVLFFYLRESARARLCVS